MSVHENNFRLMSCLAALLNAQQPLVDDEMIRSMAECGLTKSESMAYLTAAMLKLEPEGKDRTFFRQYFLPAFNSYEPDFVEQDPYCRLLNGISAKNGSWRLGKGRIDPYELFVCGDIQLLEENKMRARIGFFDRGIAFPRLTEKGREWMAVIPNEIETMRAPICRARGEVLTLGLGLGYYAYMTARKPEVLRVTVVEHSQELIDMFQREILPKIPFRQKIRVLQGDAFAYIENEAKNENYNYVFADLWHDASDGTEMYLRLKEKEANIPNVRFDYWIEDTLRCYLPGGPLGF